MPSNTSVAFDVIRYADYDPATGVWAGGTNISQNGSRNAAYPRIVANAAGSMAIVWSENTGAGWQVRTSTSANFGASWGTPKNGGTELLCATCTVEPCTTCQGSLRASLDPAGDLFVGWNGGGPSWLTSTAVLRDPARGFDEPVRHGVSNMIPVGPARTLVSTVRGTYVAWVDSEQALFRALRRHHVLGAGLAAPQAIPDNDAAGLIVPLDIADGGLPHDLGVWVDLRHANAAELVVTLTAPGGTVYTLSQGGSARIWDGPIIFTAAPGVAPVTSLAPLNGIPLDGMWRLKIVDTAAGSLGLLRDWGLRFK